MSTREKIHSEFIIEYMIINNILTVCKKFAILCRTFFTSPTEIGIEFIYKIVLFERFCGFRFIDTIESLETPSEIRSWLIHNDHK